MLEITVLGCGSSAGVPQIGGPFGRGDWGACDPYELRNRRTRSSIAIQGINEEVLLVDAGPDLRSQMLACGIGRVDEILLTHAHADHVLGLDELRTVNRSLNKVIPAFATAATLEDVRARFAYAFGEPTPGFYRPALDARQVAAGTRIRLAGRDVLLFRQDHKVTETLGLRMGRFAYSTDVVSLPEESLMALQGLDTWIVGCFGRTPHPVHAHVAQVGKWVERLRPRRTLLTHMGTDLDWDWMVRNLPPDIEPAFDGLRLEVPE